jgi:hypothetical protein
MKCSGCFSKGKVEIIIGDSICGGLAVLILGLERFTIMNWG